MSTSSSQRFPVTITHLPVTRCQICHTTIAYRPGKASDALTGHYRQAHPGTRPCTAIAVRLGAEFPGGHLAPMELPAPFAAGLRDVFGRL